MACSSAWKQENKAPERIAGDRRSDRRYPILLELRWKLIHRKRVVDTGEGRTLDLSRGGIRFESDRPLPDRLNVELSISWPVLLRGIAPLHLVVQGRIVRSEGGRTAIRMIQHEFRTVGMPANLGSVASTAVRTRAALLATVSGTASLTKIQ